MSKHIGELGEFSTEILYVLELSRLLLELWCSGLDIQYLQFVSLVSNFELVSNIETMTDIAEVKDSKSFSVLKLEYPLLDWTIWIIFNKINFR